MKAIVRIKPGPPEELKLKDVNKPVPKVNEILVKVYASSVTRGDTRLRKIPRSVTFSLGLLFGFKEMKITGVEFAGVVSEIGKNVTKFNIGDEIFGTTTGLSYGGNAEFVCIPEKSKLSVSSLKPKNLSFEESAVVPVGAMTALFILNISNIQKGDKILIYGASGSVGTYAVQLAKYFGGVVTGVCSSDNADLIQSIGADNIIDYKLEDFINSDIKYDIIFDAVGKLKKSNCRKILKKDGKFLTVKLPTKEKIEDLKFIKNLIEDDKLKPVIDKSFPLEYVPEAHKYVEEGHKKGNVVVTVFGKK